MSLGSGLTMRCKLYSREVTSTDSFGNDVRTVTLVESDVKCRLVEKTARIATPDRAELLDIVTYTMLFGKDTTITHDMVIRDVTHRGTLVNAGPFNVKSIIVRRSVTLQFSSVSLDYLGSD